MLRLLKLIQRIGGAVSGIMPDLPELRLLQVARALCPTILATVVWFTVGQAAAADYKGVIVMDAGSGDVLFEHNADFTGPPASVTKLMTFLIVDDLIEAGRLSLDTPVTVSAADSRIGGTQVWLKHNEVFPVRDLLYALMVQSANDAAHALAHAAGTTREEFVAMMNQRSREMGLKDTIWRTPHGLPPRSRRLADSDQSSPRDLARLSRVLLAETDILRYSSIERLPFGEDVRPQAVMMDNHNNLLGKVRGVDGLKTGFTRAAGFCLAATAEREDRRIIVAIMGSPSAKIRDFKVIDLLDRAFAGTLPPSILPPPPPPQKAPEAPSWEPLELPTVGAPANDASPLSPADEQEPPTVKFEMPE